MDRGCGYWFLANETDFQKGRDVNHCSQIQNIAHNEVCLYGNREDILTECYGNTKRKDGARTLWAGLHVVWINQAHELFAADTFVIWSIYILTKHTNHYCTVLSLPTPLIFFPLKATPPFLWHNNPNMTNVISAMSLTYLPNDRHARTDISFAPLCDNEKLFSCI